MSSRTRITESVSVGDPVFFYRNYGAGTAKARQAQALQGRYLGPGLIIGHQGGNVWVSFVGRCYLVALEHVRSLAPDEVFGRKPYVRECLEALKQASRATDYVDLTQQQVAAEDMAAAVEQPAGMDHWVDDEDDDIPEVAPPP